jgi:poly(ADP-ribose) glycohydrolase ARH3
LDTGRGFGCYTDDTEMTLALTHSIIQNNGVDAEHCAGSYARFYNPWRGYGAGAHAVMNALKQGADYRKTGYMMFKDGSFGNGGAMRIAPVGLVYHNKNDEPLKKAVFDAVQCTHTHPEGVDGALVQAKAVAILTNIDHAADFNPMSFLEKLSQTAETEIIKKKILYLEEVLKKDIDDETAVGFLGNGIRASEAVSCAVLATVKYHLTPEAAVIKGVNFGGDTDTIGAMTGAHMGALHGKDWIPSRWLDNMENREFGRDYIVKLAADLSRVII